MGVRGVPETRYAITGGGDRVAFQVVGDAPVDVLVARAPTFPVDLMWDEPRRPFPHAALVVQSAYLV
jgi:hypothetical protein